MKKERFFFLAIASFWISYLLGFSLTCLTKGRFDFRYLREHAARHEGEAGGVEENLWEDVQPRIRRLYLREGGRGEIQSRLGDKDVQGVPEEKQSESDPIS